MPMMGGLNPMTNFGVAESEGMFQMGGLGLNQEESNMFGGSFGNQAKPMS